MMGHYNPNPKAFLFVLVAFAFLLVCFVGEEKKIHIRAWSLHRLKNVYTDPTFFSEKKLHPPTGVLNWNLPSLPTKLRTTLLYIAPPHSLSLSLIVWSSRLHSYGRRSLITAPHPPTTPLPLWIFRKIKQSIPNFNLWFECFHLRYYSAL